MEISLQLWSLENSGLESIEDKFRAISDMGYDGVELMAPQKTAEETKALLKKYNIYAKSAHIIIDDFRSNLDELLKFHKEIGAEYIIIPWQRFDDDLENNLDDVVELLNSASIKAKEYGIKVGYHNHDKEFKKIGNKYILDLLYEKTSDDVVFELDVFWFYVSGENPINYIKKFGKRVELIHLKQSDENKKNVALPDGVLDIEEIINSAKFAKYFVVEQESSTDDVINACKKGVDYIKSFS